MSDHTLRLCDSEGRPLAFVTITHTDIGAGVTDALADAVETTATDHELEVERR